MLYLTGGGAWADSGVNVKNLVSVTDSKIRTGWGRYFGTDNARYLEGEPGIDVPGARWLIDQGITAIGTDNMAVEVLPNPDKGIAMPVHQFCLAECGVGQQLA